MIKRAEVVVTLPADVNMVDETDYVWTFLHEAPDPSRVYPGALIVAGDPVEPFLARVVDIVAGPKQTSIVHLEVLGVPEAMVDELRHANLLPQLPPNARHPARLRPEAPPGALPAPTGASRSMIVRRSGDDDRSGC